MNRPSLEESAKNPYGWAKFTLERLLETRKAPCRRRLGMN
jgi:hypothetical protein